MDMLEDAVLTEIQLPGYDGASFTWQRQILTPLHLQHNGQLKQ
jgi:hypothetical protein